MIYHTYISAKKAKLIDRLIVATDDMRVYDVCEEYGIDCHLTPDDINTGTDRAAFAASELTGADIIVNIQGDEPFISGNMIDQAIEPLLFDSNVKVSTLIKKIILLEELFSPATVKVVFDMHNFAIYFSRSPIPFVRDENDFEKNIQAGYYYKHIGLYVFRAKSLFKFSSLPASDLEQIEKLEQLRLIENGIKMKVVETTYNSISVDTPEDLERAREHYYQLPDDRKAE